MDWQISLKASLLRQMASLIQLECFKRPPWQEKEPLEKQDVVTIHPHSPGGVFSVQAELWQK